MPTETLTLRAFQGVNLQDDPRQVEDNELTLARDGYPETDGVISSRPGVALMAGAAVAPIGAGAVYLVNALDQWFFWHPNDDGVYRLSVLDAGLTSFTLVKSWPGLTQPTQVPTFLHFKDRLYVASLDFPLMHVDATLAVTEHNDMPRARVIAAYKGQLLIANIVGDAQRFWEFDIGSTGVEPNTQLIDEDLSDDVNAGDGDPITAMREVSIQGGAQYIENYLVVFKRHSVWVINGDLPTGPVDDLGEYTTVPILKGEGCPYPETIVETPYGLMWASHRDVWYLPTGGTPTRVGEKLGDLIQRRQGGLLGDWSACYSPDGFYKLMMPAPETPDVLAVAQREQWWADLRKMPKVGPRWWGPQTLAPDAHAVFGPDELMVSSGPLVADSGSLLTDLFTNPTTFAGGNTPAEHIDGLNTLLHFPLDEADAPVVSTVGGYSLADEGVPTTNATGVINFARHFDTSQSVFGSIASLAGIGDFTLWLWLDADCFPPTGTSRAFTLINSNPFPASFMWLNLQASQIELFTVGGYQVGGVSPLVTVLPWNALTITRIGTTTTVYFNGVAVITDPADWGPFFPGTWSLRLGGQPFGSYAWLEGAIDDMWFDTVGYTAPQVMAEYLGPPTTLAPWVSSQLGFITPNEFNAGVGSYLEQAAAVPVGEYVVILIEGSSFSGGLPFELYERAEGDTAPGTLLTSGNLDDSNFDTPVLGSPRVAGVTIIQTTKGYNIAYRPLAAGDAQAGTTTNRVFRLVFPFGGHFNLSLFNVGTSYHWAQFYGPVTAASDEQAPRPDFDPTQFRNDNRANLMLGTPTPDWRFKDLDFGAATLEKVVDRLELSAQADRAMTATGQLLKSRGAEGLQTSTKALTPVGLVLGSGLLGTAVQADGPVDYALYPTNGARVVTRSIQPRLQFTYGGVRLYELGVRVRPLGRRTSR